MGPTVPVYYESRLLKLDLDDDTLRLLDSEYDKLAEEGAEEQDIKRSKDENARLHACFQPRRLLTHYARTS